MAHIDFTDREHDSNIKLSQVAWMYVAILKYYKSFFIGTCNQRKFSAVNIWEGKSFLLNVYYNI